MEVKVCRRCKRMFQYIAGPEICEQCKKKEEIKFQEVKEYLRQKPGSTMKEVSQETDTPISMIEGFLRQGRLQVSPDSPISLLCEKCGAKILTGRYCSKCNAQLIGGLHSLATEMKTEIEAENAKKASNAGDKMRFLKSDKIK